MWIVQWDSFIMKICWKKRFVGSVNSAWDPGLDANARRACYPNVHLGFVWILLIVENWKHCSKIIFKCVNSTVGPNFKVVLWKKYLRVLWIVNRTHQKNVGHWTWMLDALSKQSLSLHYNTTQNSSPLTIATRLFSLKTFSFMFWSNY